MAFAELLDQEIMAEPFLCTAENRSEVCVMQETLERVRWRMYVSNDSFLINLTSWNSITRGHLGREWTDWFEGLTLTLEDNGETLLTGPVVDQAALYGLLRKVRDVGMSLLSVVCVKPDQAVALDVKQEKND